MIGRDQAWEDLAAYFVLGVGRIERVGASNVEVLALGVIVETLCALPRHANVAILQDADETFVEENIQRFRNEHVPKAGSRYRGGFFIVLRCLVVSTCC